MTNLKANLKLKSVKEQRVDGSWHLRYPLVFKVYSNGFWKKLSSQNPFLENNKLIGYTLYKGSVPLCLTRKLKLVNNSLLSNQRLNFTTVSPVSTLPAWWISGFVDAEGCFPPQAFLLLKIKIIRVTLDLHLFMVKKKW
jgi:hypothetical protein